MLKKYCNIATIVIIVFLGFFLHRNYINEFPSYTHAWAQSDRYALAQGFVNNDLNFFKPETFVYNHQFPDEWEIPSQESITAVDFPLHDYIPAVLMKLLNNKSPWIFRLYILIYSFVGLFYLFKFADLMTRDFSKSIFITIFAATSPVFVYYQGGFLPTIPSLANAIIGIYFYTKHLLTGKQKLFNLALLFLTLATLSRTTFAIPLIAMLGAELLRFITKKTSLKPKLFPVLLALSSILFFFFYNAWLRNMYGSIFLNHILPATSFNQFIEIIKIVTQKWITQYFSTIHYFLLAALLGILIITKAKGNTNKSKISSNILVLTSIIFLGCIAFALLMLRQFPAHDYYFLDTFFLPSTMLLVIVLAATPTFTGQRAKYLRIIGVVVISLPLIVNANKSQKGRRTTSYWDRTTATINNFKGSDIYLDSLGISENAKMLVIDAYAPNIPFLLMNRKGYAVMSTKRGNIIQSLNWDYDYIVMQNEFFLSDIYSTYPAIIDKTEKVWDNGRISICRMRNTDTVPSLTEYLGLDKRIPVKEEMMNFDSLSNTNWQNITPNSHYSFSGNKSGTLTRDMVYGLTYKTKKLPEIVEKNRILAFQSYFLHDSIDNVELVVAINENDKNAYYKAYNLKGLLTKPHEWEKVNLVFQLPKVNSDDYEFALYLWNTGKSELYLDDFEFKIY